MTTQPLDPTFQPSESPLASRMVALGQQHPWMDPQMQVALSTSGQSDSALSGIIDTIRNSVTSLSDATVGFQHDPVLEAKPTLSTYLRQYLHSVLGPLPVNGGDVKNIQTALAGKGFGQELPADGVWNPAWSAAYRQYHDKFVQTQLAGGNRPGSATVGAGVNALVSAMPGKKSGNAIVGFFKSLPGDVRSLAGDLVGVSNAASAEFSDPRGMLAGLLHGTKTGRGKEHLEQTRQAFGAGAAATERFFGADTQTSDIIKDTSTPEGAAQAKAIALNRATNDLSTGLLLLDLAGSAAKIGALTAGEGVTKDAALRGPGVIARTLGAPVGRRAVVGGALGGGVGGLQAGLRGQSVMSGVEHGAAIGAVGAALIPESVFSNLPVVGRMGPWVSRLADADGLYYRARTAIAAPYRHVPVQVAGQAATQAGLFGGAVRLAANASQDLSSIAGAGPNTYAQQVLGEHTFDHVQDRIRAVLRQELGASIERHLRFATNIDNLALVLHGPLHGPGTTSARVADTVDSQLRNVDRALGEVGIEAQAQRALVGPGGFAHYDDAVKAAGGIDRLNGALVQKFREYAANLDAHDTFNRLPDAERVSGEVTKREWIRHHEGEVFADPARMAAAWTKAASLTEDHGFTNYLLREAAYTRTSLPEMVRTWGKYLEAGDALKQVLASDRGALTTVRDFVSARTGVAGDPESGLGRFGLMRADGRTAVELHDEVARLREFHDAALAEADPAVQAGALKASYEQAIHHLWDEHGLDQWKTRIYPDTGKLLDLADNLADHTAGAVFPALGVSDATKALLQRITDSGYKVVHGTDIGHAFESHLPDLNVLDGQITRQRRVAQRLGLSPERFSSRDHSAYTYAAIRNRVQGLVDGGDIALPPAFSVDSLMGVLNEEARQSLPAVESAAAELGARARPAKLNALAQTAEARRIAEEVKISPRDAAILMLKRDLAGQVGLRDLSAKKMTAILTAERDLPLAPGETMPLLSHADAMKVRGAVLAGYADRPGYMTGLSRLEDLWRGGFYSLAGSEGKVRSAVGEGLLRALPEHVVELPNDLIRFRDRLRFKLNPEFDLRRIAKSNVKMAAHGIAPTADPGGWLLDKGLFDQAHEVLNRIRPARGADAYGDIAHYLHSQSITGLYSARDFEAYAAHHLAGLGASDEQIGRELTRMFSYGNRYGEGRSALERSVNFVFFPFSFTKTLYRETGGYLLDHPGQAVVLDRGLRAYKEFNDHHLNGDNPLAASFIERHFPVLEELHRLNAFEHGISPGEFGGINRPLANMFVPQLHSSDATTTDTFKRLLPVYGEVIRIATEGRDQARIAANAIYNSYDSTVRKFGIHGGPGGPYYVPGRKVHGLLGGVLEAVAGEKQIGGSTVTQVADREAGFDMRRKLVASLAPILDYNAGVRGDDGKYRFGNDPTLPALVRGEVINRRTIGYFVEHFHPAFDPSKTMDYVAAKQKQIDLFLASKKGTPGYADYRTFTDRARQASAYLTSDSYTTQEAAGVQQLLRNAAATLASRDSDFYRLYKKYFASTYGPLEAVT